jgi:predicted Zn-ribbon and HTH transcriptional regulator
MIKLYNIEDKYLYEILDDYKSSENQDEIFRCFMNKIWHSSNTRQIYTKYIRFTMLPEIVDTDIGQVFYNYVNIPYIASKTMTNNIDYISLIRQKINNIYNNYCEPRLCTRKDYMELLHMPKKLYFRWEKNQNDCENVDDLSKTLKESLAQAEELKNQYSKQKMNLTWKQFKPIVEKYIRRAFENYVPLDEYENKNEFVLDTDLWTEDNFAIKYVCNCLQQGMKDYQKEYYGLYRKGKRSRLKYKRCQDCGKMFFAKSKDTKSKLCDECQHEHIKEYDRKRKNNSV